MIWAKRQEECFCLLWIINDQLWLGNARVKTRHRRNPVAGALYNDMFNY